MENIRNILTFVLIAIDVLLVCLILIQQREGGLSNVFGGEGNVYRSKRGLAKGIHYTTIVLAVLFVGLSVAVLFLA
ncbi:MAG: preprotein translocase subunit SecG [Candidatus Doudnabacteria bacterium]|nr:preprotein translocase subunit SecG [Candidatus Doudnabacteria bacterium]